MLHFRGDQTRGFLAEVVNAQPEKQTMDRVLFGLLYSGLEVGSGFGAEALQLGDGFVIKAVQIGNGVEPAQAEKAQNGAAAQSLDVHSVFGSMVHHALEDLGFAVGIFAAPDGLVGRLHQRAGQTGQWVG